MRKYTVEAYDDWFGKELKKYNIIQIIVNAITDQIAIDKAKQIVERENYRIIKIEEVEK